MSNVQNGKAFEYALAIEYTSFVKNLGLSVILADTPAVKTAKKYFESSSIEERARYLLASRTSIATMMKLEAGFTSPKNSNDILQVRIASDSEGINGDVRDVIFTRPVSMWEVGFSAKNNNDAVKHSRLSATIDFGYGWFGHNVSAEYWNAVKPIFAWLQQLKEENKKWSDIEDKKEKEVYAPILEAFKDELLRLNREYSDIPFKVVMYLLGKKPFYKIIKDDSANVVIIKAFNINGELNRTVNGRTPAYRTKKVYLPTRIIEFDYKSIEGGEKSCNTLNMVLDHGWEISFRIHNASTMIEPSLKFDVQMLGNPPVLFTQYLFQD